MQYRLMILRETGLLGYFKVFVLTIFFCLTSLRATPQGGSDFPDSVKVGTKSLVLNGTGIRTATIFKVRVYAAALYLEKKETAPEAILSSKTAKQIRMVFQRDVKGEDIRKAWDESFRQACGDQCASHLKHLEQLKLWMPDVKEKDKMTYTFTEQGVSLDINDQARGVLPANDFARILLSTWIGEHPPTEKLKDGLLGRPS